MVGGVIMAKLRETVLISSKQTGVLLLTKGSPHQLGSCLTAQPVNLLVRRQPAAMHQPAAHAAGFLLDRSVH
jgi:hypothetical protein